MPSDQHRYREYRVTVTAEAARHVKEAAKHYGQSEQQVLARAITLGAAFMEREVRGERDRLALEKALTPEAGQ